MKLDIIFRTLLEDVGLEYLLSDQSINYLKDLSDISTSSIYLWSSMLRDGLVHECINTTGSTECVNELAYKYARHTGFNYENIRVLLGALSLGMMQACWGIIPDKVSLTLAERFIRNKVMWEERLPILEKGVFRILKKGKYGFITSDGRPYINAQYKDVGMYSEGLACVLDFQNNFYFINLLGNIEIELKNIPYDQSMRVGEMNHGMAIILKKGKYGLINRLGEKSDSQLDYIKSNRTSTLVVYDKEKCGLMDSETFKMLTPFKYEEIKAFADDKQKFTKALTGDGKSILLSHDGKEVSVGEEIVKIDIIDNLILMFDPSGRLIVFNEDLKSFDYHYGLIIDDRYGGILKRTTIDYPNTPILYYRNRYGVYASGRGFIFIKHNGQPLNDKPYSKAFQFNKGIAWVKKGNNWYRINIHGEVLEKLIGLDILTPEYEGKVLARDLSSGLIELVTYDGKIVFTIPDSEESEPIMNRHYQYIIESEYNDFVWYNGVLTQISGRMRNGISNSMMMKSHYFLNKLDDGSFEVQDFQSGQSYIFQTKEKEDYIFHNSQCSKLRRGLLCCKTTARKYYLVDVYTNKYSEYFEEIKVKNNLAIGKRDGKDFLIDSHLNIIACYDAIS